MSMYTSKQSTSTETKKSLEKKLIIFLNSNTHLYYKVLKKKVFLNKLPQVIVERNSASQRLKRFFVSIDILKHSKDISKTTIDGNLCYELIGYKWNENTNSYSGGERYE